MADTISIRPQPGIWTVRAGGAVLGETTNALVVSTGQQPEVVYFPREDIAMAFLEPSATRTSTPGIGEAVHYSITSPSEVIDDAAWSFEAPASEAAAIAGHLAFRPSDRITIEEL